MTNLDSILKSSDITLPTKVHIIKLWAFPVVMYECESWTIKKTEHWRIDASELCCRRRLLRVFWTARRSVLSFHWKDWCWSWSSNTLANDVKNCLIWKDPDAGKDWNQEEKGTTKDEKAGWHHWPDGHEFEQISGVGDGQGGLACCNSWGHKELDTTEWLNRTELNSRTAYKVAVKGSRINISPSLSSERSHIHQVNRSYL